MLSCYRNTSSVIPAGEIKQQGSIMETIWVENGENRLEVKLMGSGPVILCVHGWPELWYSWRHQMAYFADQGYTVAAMNVRGYGGSSRPADVDAYTLSELSSDVQAVAQHLSDQSVILFGHDWGAPIVYQSALRYPALFSAVTGLSVPYMPSGEQSTLDLFQQIYAGRFFYQLYFQATDVAEAAFEADIQSALRKVYFSLSGDAPLDDWLKQRPADAALLDDLLDPQPFPAWLSEADLGVYAEAFGNSGFRGPFNRYRAQQLDTKQLVDHRGKKLEQPSCLIAGERDAVRNFIPGIDLYENAAAGCSDYRGTTIIEAAGHWVQQEAPAETNAALDQFLQGL